MNLRFNIFLFLCSFLIVSCNKSEDVIPDLKANEIKKEGLYFYMEIEDQKVYYQDSLSNYTNQTGTISYLYYPDSTYMKGSTSYFYKNSSMKDGIMLEFWKHCDSADVYTNKFFYTFNIGEYKYANILKSIEGPEITWFDSENIQWSSDDLYSYNHDNGKFTISNIESTSNQNSVIISGSFSAILGHCGILKKVNGDFRMRINFQN
jgi:hypothetical protein